MSVDEPPEFPPVLTPYQFLELWELLVQQADQAERYAASVRNLGTPRAMGYRPFPVRRYNPRLANYISAFRNSVHTFDLPTLKNDEVLEYYRHASEWPTALTYAIQLSRLATYLIEFLGSSTHPERDTHPGSDTHPVREQWRAYIRDLAGGVVNCAELVHLARHVHTLVDIHEIDYE